MSTLRDRHRLLDVVSAAAQIAEYIGSSSEVDFREDNMLHDAVIMQLIVVGESSSKLSTECRAKCPAIDWTGIVNLRHRLAHDYFGTDLRIAWEVATIHVPRLHRDIAQILALEYPEEI